MNSPATAQQDDELVKLYVEAALDHGQGADRAVIQHLPIRPTMWSPLSIVS